VEKNTRLQFEHLVDAHERTWMPDGATATGGCTDASLCAAAATFATISLDRQNDRSDVEVGILRARHLTARASSAGRLAEVRRPSSRRVVSPHLERRAHCRLHAIVGG
jgi:hypothetical protein